ncbi:MAG: alpha-amylase family glycosyl hydrolase [Bacteroidales bacterium]|nr:alpha-amylase family glycosyl hydrolase [Bacteroidales bacterium]
MSIKSFMLSASVLMASALSLSAQEGIHHMPSWIHEAVVYQVYPSSFQDSDGNGMNPIFVSGWTDGGYDIINFYKVDPRFGTNSDLVALVNKAHSLGMKVVLDLVAGHSSDQCEWFIQSQEADPNQRYSDYYIWPSFKPEDPTEKSGQQLDYAALMNSSASLLRKFVKTDAPRGPYFVKNFFDTQPALNYGFANPDPNHPWEQGVDDPGPQAMRRELKNIMQFWMDKGVDGFRVDMAASLVKNDFDKSATIALWQNDFSSWFKKNYPENVLIAEWFNPSQSIEAGFNIDFFCHDGQYNYSTLFFNINRRNNEHQDCYFDLAGNGELKTWYDLYTYQYDAVKGKGYVSMPSGNHDFTRLSAGTRTSTDQLKVAMTFFLTMPGVPFLYYGDEIGLTHQGWVSPVEGAGARTGTRIPMLWDSSKNAGFSTADADKLYIPQDPDPKRRTAESEMADPNSLLNYVKTLLQLRLDVPALGNDGDWKLVSSLDQPYPMAYERTINGSKCLVVINPSAKKVSVDLPTYSQKSPKIVGGFYKKVTFKQGKVTDKITIDGCSAVIYQIN